MAEEEPKKRKLPTKYYRVRAHRNPLNDALFNYPIAPGDMIWSDHYPKIDEEKKQVEYLDVGCGYGGLSTALAEMFPDKYILALDIRDQVVDYLKAKITNLRLEHAATGGYQNVSALVTNAMKLLPHFFYKGQLQKMFFLFPDPHFKKSKHRLRIVNNVLLAEYAYLLAIGGKLYTISDVKDTADWMQMHCDNHPLFERVSDEENASDPVVPLVQGSSEEAKKVERSGGSKYLAVYRRIANPRVH